MDFVYRQYIDGAWVDAKGGGTSDVLDPATEELVRTVPFGDADDCRAAIDAASAAFADWARATPYARGEILRRTSDLARGRLDELARTTVRESGKPLAEARREWMVAADLFEWFAEEGKRAYGRVIPARTPTKRMLTLKQPLGVVGVITAWNFPIYNPARAWAAALAAGCTVVARPSSYTPLSAMDLTNLLVAAGIPAGVLNLINVDADAAGQTMLEHPACRKISFTGSTPVGERLMDGASRTHTRLALELGGNAPVLVFPDVDLEALMPAAVRAKFRNNGQVCIAPQRYLVQERVYDEFVERVVPEVRSLRLGHGLEPETEVGPLIHAKQRAWIERLVEDARKEGVEVAAGGRRPERFAKGYFYEPTVMTGVRPGARVFREEIFGPILPVTPFGDVDEAIALANATPFGLAAFVWTRDLALAVRAWEGIECGMVGVNEWAPHASEAPFGGWKQSGVGHEAGCEGLDDYLETKLVSIGGL
jgi:acyl-CoA reductase-like NAD-dependent aldehyde dehydrogenase